MIHHLTCFLRIPSKNEIKQPLEVGRHLNIHGRGQTGNDRPKGVLTGIKKAMQYVVLIGRHPKTTYANAHLGQEPTREDVSEIAGRDDEGGGFPRPFPKPQPSVKIIDGLGEYAGQIDRVHCGQTDFLTEPKVRKEFLYRMLGIIEGTLDGDGKYVFRLRAGHLAFLQRGNLPVGIEDEHRDPTLPEKAGDLRRLPCRRK